MLNFSKKIIARSNQAGGAPVAVMDEELKDTTYDDADGNPLNTNFLSMYEKAQGSKASTYDTEKIKQWIQDFEDNATTLNTEFLKWSRSKYNTYDNIENLINKFQNDNNQETGGKWHPPFIIEGQEDSPQDSGTNKESSEGEKIQKLGDIYSQSPTMQGIASFEKIKNEYISEGSPSDVSGWALEMFNLPESEYYLTAAPKEETIEDTDTTIVSDVIIDKNDKSGITSNNWKSISTGLAAFGAYSYKDKLEKGYNMATNSLSKASRYIHSASKLSAPQITQFLETPSVQNTLNNIKKQEDKIKNLQVGTEEYKTAKKRLNNIMNNRSSYWAKKFKVKKEHINKLWKTKDRWDIFQFKADLKNKYPKVAKEIFQGKYTPKTSKFVKGGMSLGRTYLPYKVGSMVSDALGVEGLGSIPTTLAAGYGTEKGVSFLYNKVKNMIATPKGRKFIMNKAGKTIGKKIIQGAKTPGHPYMRVIAGLAGGVAGGVDLYRAILDYKEE